MISNFKESNNFIKGSPDPAVEVFLFQNFSIISRED